MVLGKKIQLKRRKDSTITNGKETSCNRNKQTKKKEGKKKTTRDIRGNHKKDIRCILLLLRGLMVHGKRKMT